MRILVVALVLALGGCAARGPLCTDGPCGERCCNDDGRVCCPDWDWFPEEEVEDE